MEQQLPPGLGERQIAQLVNVRYECGAVIQTSNRGFSEWGEVSGDTVVAAALLDRLHHAIVIEIAGNSYRLREHARLVPDSLPTTGSRWNWVGVSVEPTEKSRQFSSTASH